jgi:hypothetical protein
VACRISSGQIVDPTNKTAWPAGGHESRARVITQEIIPLDQALQGIDLSEGDIGLLAWLVKFGEGARVATFLTKIRNAPKGRANEHC